MKKIVVVLAIVIAGSMTLVSSPSRADNCQEKYDEAQKAFSNSEMNRNLKEKVRVLLQKASDLKNRGKKKGCVKMSKKAMNMMNQ